MDYEALLRRSFDQSKPQVNLSSPNGNGLMARARQVTRQTSTLKLNHSCGQGFFRCSTVTFGAKKRGISSVRLNTAGLSIRMTALPIS